MLSSYTNSFQYMCVCVCVCSCLLALSPAGCVGWPADGRGSDRAAEGSDELG